MSIDSGKVLPDPGQLRGLAAQWSAMADALRALATAVAGAAGDDVAWSEDDRQAVNRASGAVAKTISAAAESAARLAQQIGAAAMNYGQVGDVVTDMFNKTVDALGPGGSGCGDSASDSSRDVSSMPITERG